MSLWTSNMTPPPWIFLSFLYTLYGQVSGKSSEVAIELSILGYNDRDHDISVCRVTEQYMISNT